MLTITAPISAVANWVSSHSGRFGAQMPIRSPLPKPSATRPAAKRRASSFSSRQVQRRPLPQNTAAVASGQAAAVSASSVPMVFSSSGGAFAPMTRERPSRGPWSWGASAPPASEALSSDVIGLARSTVQSVLMILVSGFQAPAYRVRQSSSCSKACAAR